MTINDDTMTNNDRAMTLVNLDSLEKAVIAMRVQEGYVFLM